MKNCNKCNLTFDDDKKFCNACGSQLTLITNIESRVEIGKTGKRCVRCNLEYEEDKKFCKKCGSPLVTIRQTVSKVDAKRFVFEEKLKDNQLDIKLLSEYAQFLFESNEYKESCGILLRILAIEDTNDFANNLIFTCYVELHQYKDAVEVGEELLTKNAKDISLLEKLAILSNNLKKSEEEFNYYSKIIEIESDNIPALKYLFNFYIEKNKISEALKICEKLVLLGETDRLLTIYFGVWNALRGKFEIYDFDQNVVISNDIRTDIHINRCRLYLTYCFCMVNDDILKIENKFNSIDFKKLKEFEFE
jgi:tetratricopeptide (TPR) repeat protein